MCNAPMILPNTIDEGINTLRKEKNIDWLLQLPHTICLHLLELEG